MSMTKPEVMLIITEAPEDLVRWAEKAQAAGITLHRKTMDDLDSLEPSLFQGLTVLLEWLPVSDDRKEAFYLRVWDWLRPETLVLTAAHERMAGQVAQWLPHSNQVVGFSPLGDRNNSDLVTLAYTMQNGTEVRGRVEALVKSLEMDYAWIQDTPGMVLPRIYAMLANEAAYALQEKVATAEDIDTAMCLGTNYPMGPLAWADAVGVDVVYHILENLCAVYREERYRPCLLLQKMMMAGLWGRRTGQGFYKHQPAPQGKELASL